MNKIDFDFFNNEEREENRHKIAQAVQEKVEKYFSDPRLKKAIKEKKQIDNDDFFVIDYIPKKGEFYNLDELFVRPYIEINKASNYKSSEIIDAIIVSSAIGLCNEILRLLLSSKCSRLHSTQVRCELEDRIDHGGKFILKPSFEYKIYIILRKDFG